MANRFEKATWPDRQVQYPSRRRLTATAETDVWDVERVEGEIIEAGKAFGDTNMSNLETRIYNAFDTLESSDVKLTDNTNVFTATTVDGALTELFQSAGSGKTAIATAIGAEANISDTFPQLATKISNGKLAIANALGNSALQTSTFAYLAALTADFRNQALTKKKVAIVTSLIPDGTYGNTVYANMSFDLGFVPSYIFVVGVTLQFELSSVFLTIYTTGFSSLVSSGNSSVTNISQTGCTLTAISTPGGQVRFGADQKVTVIGIE